MRKNCEKIVKPIFNQSDFYVSFREYKNMVFTFSENAICEKQIGFTIKSLWRFMMVKGGAGSRYWKTQNIYST